MQSQADLEQLPEVIHIEGVLHSLYTTPLLPWLARQVPSIVFDKRTPKCDRGYIGRWKVEDDSLWLTGIYAWRGGKNTGLFELFGDRDEVAADWFTGPLVVEPVSWAIADGVYPKVRTLLVEAGKVLPDAEV